MTLYFRPSQESTLSRRIIKIPAFAGMTIDLLLPKIATLDQIGRFPTF